MAKKNSLKEVQFCTDRDGSVRMAGYVNDDCMSHTAPNEPFDACLKLVDYSRGQSSTKFHFQDQDTEITYPMFVSSMFDLVSSTEALEPGEFWGTWIAIKRGQNFGIELYEGDA